MTIVSPRSVAPTALDDASAAAMPRERRLALYRSILRIRRIEERIQALYPQGDMRCPTHFSIGQEAVAAGVCSNLRHDDYVISAHRSHAHYLAKGGSLRAMFAELYGKATGCAAGKGGSMHLIDLAVNFLGCVPIVGSTIPIGVGAAFGAMLQDRSALSVIFFGDAAVETGVFHESVNFAAVHRLPVLFVCENNLYSVNTPLADRQPENRTIPELIRGHGIRTSQHDGQLVETVDRATADMLAHVRGGGGPALLEFMTYRWLEHCGPLEDTHLGYRSQTEMDGWTARCPLRLQRKALEHAGLLDAATHRALEAALAAEIDEAVDFAKRSPFPERSELGRHLFATVAAATSSDVQAEPTAGAKPASHRQLTFAEAINEALDICLARDRSVYLMGLGVPDPIGVFGTTRGLHGKHGGKRVLDMPVAENAMTGAALGSCLVGMRPVLSHMRLEFAIPSMDQICNQAAKWHYMFGGRANVPLTIRMLIGRGWGQGPQHSQSLHAWFAHIPGLKVVMPSTPHDAKGLLIASIEDDNPVIFFEHRWLHGLHGPVPEGHYTVPIGEPRIVSEGSDVTIVAASYATIEAIKAARVLERQGIAAEVIDLRTLVPRNDAAILASVRKTGRLVVVDQGTLTGGFAGEIVARVTEQAFAALKSAPIRVTLPDLPTPTTRALSNYYYPTPAHIVAAVRRSLGLPPSQSSPTERGEDARADAVGGPVSGQAGTGHDDPWAAIEPADKTLDVPDKTFTGPF
jgi:2-oxoisovalerate dehydrogenase E1 component